MPMCQARRKGGRRAAGEGGKYLLSIVSATPYLLVQLFLNRTGQRPGKGKGGGEATAEAAQTRPRVGLPRIFPRLLERT